MERCAERKEQGRDSWLFSHREELSPPKDSPGAKQQRTAVLLSPGVWAHALQSGSRHNLGQLPFKYKGVEGQGGARSHPRSHGSCMGLPFSVLGVMRGGVPVPAVFSETRRPKGRGSQRKLPAPCCPLPKDFRGFSFICEMSWTLSSLINKNKGKNTCFPCRAVVMISWK